MLVFKLSTAISSLAVTPAVARMRVRTGQMAHQPKPSLYGDRSMNAFRTTRMFALVACTTVATLTSAAAHAKNGRRRSCRHGSSCHGSCGSYCSSYCPSYCSSYCRAIVKLLLPQLLQLPGELREPVTCAPQTRAPVTALHASDEYVPVTNYVPTTTWLQLSRLPTPRTRATATSRRAATHRATTRPLHKPSSTTRAATRQALQVQVKRSITGNGSRW